MLCEEVPAGPRAGLCRDPDGDKVKGAFEAFGRLKSWATAQLVELAKLAVKAWPSIQVGRVAASELPRRG